MSRPYLCSTSDRTDLRTVRNIMFRWPPRRYLGVLFEVCRPTGGDEKARRLRVEFMTGTASR